MIDQFVTIEQRVIKKQPQLATTAHISGLLTHLGLSDAVQEELWVVTLDGSRNVRTVVCAAKGGYHDCDVSMPTILSPVFLAGTDRFFVAHNHPSGQLDPTDYDNDLTGWLVDAAEMLDLIFEDHVIVGPGGDWYSLRGHQQLGSSREGLRAAQRSHRESTPSSPAPPSLPAPPRAVSRPPSAAPKASAALSSTKCEACGLPGSIGTVCVCGWRLGAMLPVPELPSCERCGQNRRGGSKCDCGWTVGAPLPRCVVCGDPIRDRATHGCHFSSYEQRRLARRR